MRAVLTKPLHSAEDFVRIIPKRAVIDHPDAWKLVTRSVGKPIDEECRAAVQAYYRWHLKGGPWQHNGVRFGHGGTQG